MPNNTHDALCIPRQSRTRQLFYNVQVRFWEVRLEAIRNYFTERRVRAILEGHEALPLTL